MLLNQKQLIIDEFWADWVAEDGLARLWPKEREIAAYGRQFRNGRGQVSAYNANAILFLAYFMILAKSPKGRIEEVISSLEVDGIKGLYHRWPSSPYEHERHDNYAAIAVLSALYGLPFAKDIVEYGEKHFWYFNNIEPYRKFNIMSEDDWAQVRQPGEIALYRACMGKFPGIFTSIWLCGGILVNAFNADPGKTNLSWIRCTILHKRPLFRPIVKLWAFIKGFRFKGGIKEPLELYFTKEHPIAKLAALLPDTNKWSF